MLASHKQRILTALVILPFLALVLWQKGIFISLSILLVSFLALNEFYSFFWPGKKNFSLRITGNILGAALILTPLSVLGNNFALLTLLCFWLLALIFLFDFGFKESLQFQDIALVFLSLIYIPLALKLFENFSRTEILLVLFSAFASDTGAYYTGLLWGKKKIWPKVSPKKTWIGSMGGLISCILVNLSFGLFLEKQNLPFYLALGIALNLAAQLGDFFESALKRKLNIKDSGTLLPGHGGILDRIDSLLFILPLYYLFKYLKPFLG
ncbi:MAG: phosphatidate cytidylyltransferase [Desulfonauticus sp.]|nr:phosphatidate cytidylyltransferase [Desulfonauticus sp.]